MEERVEITAKIKISDTEVFERVASIISWYHGNCTTDDISEILKKRDQLAVLSYNVAFISADFKSMYNTSYYMRKIEVAKQKQGFINNRKMTISMAELESQISGQGYLKAEIEAEAASYKVDLLLKQINKILEAMNQRIAFARAEEFTNRNQSQNG